ncbi:MAG TPA: O-antigen ligase family protein [Candidatus Lokiarchaeia archaeon]
MVKLQKIFKEIFYILLVAPVLFLLVNKWPYLLVGSVLISILIGFIFFIKKRSVTSFHSELLAILGVIYVYFILSYFVSGQPLSNLLSYQFLKFDGNFFFCYILFFIFSISFSNFKKLADYYFKFIFSVFTIFSLIGIAEYFLSSGFLMVLTDVGAGKIYFALNFAHNATGSVYAVVCIFLLVFFLKEKILKIKILFIILLLINLLALLLTKSRASYLGFFGAAIIVVWLHFKSIKKFSITIGALIVVTVPILFLTGVYNRVIQILNFKSATTIIRFYIWEKAWYLFSQSPIFGIGYGRFNDVFNIDRGVFDIGRLRGYPGIVSFYMKQNFLFDSAHAHNSYLQFLTETGVIGLGLILIFWTLCIVKILKAYNSTKENFTSKVLLSSLASIFVLLILSFFENFLSATTVMIPISVLVPISIGLYWESYNKISGKWLH